MEFYAVRVNMVTLTGLDHPRRLFDDTHYVTKCRAYLLDRFET